MSYEVHLNLNIFRLTNLCSYTVKFWSKTVFLVKLLGIYVTFLSEYLVSLLVKELIAQLKHNTTTSFEQHHENLSSVFLTRPDTYWSVQPQKIAIGLKFQI